MELYCESGSVYGKRILNAVRLGNEKLRPSITNRQKDQPVETDLKTNDKAYQKDGV